MLARLSRRKASTTSGAFDCRELVKVDDIVPTPRASDSELCIIETAARALLPRQRRSATSIGRCINPLPFPRRFRRVVTNAQGVVRVRQRRDGLTQAIVYSHVTHRSTVSLSREGICKRPSFAFRAPARARFVSLWGTEEGIRAASLSVPATPGGAVRYHS